MELPKNPKSIIFIAAVLLSSIFISASSAHILLESEIKNGLPFNESSYIVCENPTKHAFDFAGEGTIEAWVKVTTTPPAANSTTFFSILAKDEGPGENNKWIFGLQNGKLVFHINSPYKNPTVPFSQFLTIYSRSFELKLNKYYHFAISKDRGNIVTFYINGLNVGSSLLMRATPMVNAPLLIGNAEPGFSMHGEIHEVRIWKKALKANEIKEWMFREIDSSHPEYMSLAECFTFSNIKGTVVTSQNGLVGRIETSPMHFLNKPLLPNWIVILVLIALIVVTFCLILYRMHVKMSQKKRDWELFTAQMMHENNNCIGMILNILSSQLNNSGLGHLETQLNRRLQIVANLQSTEYSMPYEKGIAFKKYIISLVNKINEIFNTDKQIEYNINIPEQIKAKHAFKLAILIRELTLNSLKHAFNETTNGQIFISLMLLKDGFVHFEFSDNGTGIISEEKVRPAVGTALINSISSQLGSSPEICNNNGYKFVLLFKQ